jgi:undecaprenyl-diphosphatase
MFHALVLGALQGLSEFLPISSSAHLVVAPWLFGWEDPGLAFDVALHWGTLFAVVAYFRRDIGLLIRGFIHSLFPSMRDIKNNIYQKLAWLLLVASVPAALVGKLLEEKAETALRSPLLIAATLSIVGILLYIADHSAKKLKNLGHITWLNSLVIGLSQAAAVIPGVSRSGATITAGLFQNFTREDAARFSFLMSIPIIFGAGLVKLPDVVKNGNPPELIIGFIAAAVFGFLSIRFLLRYLSHRSFAVFTIYRLALAAIILVVYLIR